MKIQMSTPYGILSMDKSNVIHHLTLTEEETIVIEASLMSLIVDENGNPNPKKYKSITTKIEKLIKKIQEQKEQKAKQRKAKCLDQENSTAMRNVNALTDSETKLKEFETLDHESTD
jgi:acetyl-CoA carboxylase carboxyltransferase component